jgi:hypothetical protein
MNKQFIVVIAASVIIAGLMGFYSGRFYERNSFRRNMQNRFDNGRFQRGQYPVRDGSGNRFGPPDDAPRLNLQQNGSQPNNMQQGTSQPGNTTTQ